MTKLPSTPNISFKSVFCLYIIFQLGFRVQDTKTCIIFPTYGLKLLFKKKLKCYIHHRNIIKIHLMSFYKIINNCAYPLKGQNTFYCSCDDLR